MKYVKTAALLLFAAAIVAVVIAYVRRETIARDVANSILSGTDVVVAELTVDTLSTKRVAFAKIVLELAGGTRVDVRGLAFPLSFPSVRPEHLSIERVTVEPAAAADRAPYSDTLDAVLRLPAIVPNTAVTVGELRVPGAPTVEQLVWTSADRLQRVSFGILGARLDVELAAVADTAHRVTVHGRVGTAPDIVESGLPAAFSRPPPPARGMRRRRRHGRTEGLE